MTNIMSIPATCGINNKNQPRKSCEKNCEPLSFKMRLSHFCRREDGAILSFALIIITLMMLVGGLAVDVMRAEHQRTKIQYTQDRAVLAAASLKNTSFLPGTSPQQVAQNIFNDYFEKSGIAQFTPTAVIQQGLNYRRVSTQYGAGQSPTINTFFIDMLGIETLATPASAVARDQISKVEISLVLDVSGSMSARSASGNTRLVDLQNSANEFVDTLLLNLPDDSDTFSISIVPYSTQVTAGQTLLDQYTTTDEHDYSHCVNFTNADFGTTEILASNTLQRTGHFARGYWAQGLNFNWRHRTCTPDTARDGTSTGRQILPLTDNIATLKGHINGLVASGWTSTELGIKWGAALLDPSAQVPVQRLIDDGVIDSKFSGRPHAFTEQNTLKVMIVMTDGVNTRQFMLDPDVSEGLSNVWYTPHSSNRSYYRNGDRHKFWVYNPDRSSSRQYRRLFYRAIGWQNWTGSWAFHWDTFRNPRWERSPGINAKRLTYPELWDLFSMRFVSRYLYGPSGLGDNWSEYHWTGHFHSMNWHTKDTNMARICAATKENNVLLYTIGFEISDYNAAKLQSCATTPAHFFRVDGLEISDAFSSIAAQLSNLRLVE